MPGVSSVLRPVGRHRAAVYWRRRAVLLVPPALVVGVLALTLGGGSEPAAETPAPVESLPAPAVTPDVASEAEAPEGSDGAGETRPCGDRLAVQVSADAAEYPGGAAPLLTLVVSATGDGECTVATGSSHVGDLVVTADGGQVWSSADCGPQEPVDVVLAPGEEHRQVLTWQRVRSEPGCVTGLRDVAPGSYRVTGRVGDVASEPVDLRLG